MKKRFLSVISAVVALVTCVCASGCSLVTKNSEREMNTVVATVNVNTKEDVYKKDMIMAYLNYGYYYVQYQGYTTQQTFELILENLINNRILVQNAVKEAGKNSVEECLSDEQKTEAKYDTYKAINDMLDEYAHYTDGHDHENDHEKGDTLTLTARTSPTNAANKEKDVDKQAYIDAGFDLDSTSARREAASKFVKLLKNNGLLGEKYDSDKQNVTETTYYENLYKSNCESVLLEAYYEKIEKDTRKITMTELSAEFAEKINDQKEWSYSEFVDALGNAKASDPIVYGAFGSYGYVYNLLLGANDLQTAAINEIKKDDASMSDDDYYAARNAILKGTTVKDQRASWILSGYDFDYESKKFTGDYTFTTAANSLAFQGDVVKLKDATDDESAQYSVTSVRTFGLEEFIDFMDGYVYGESKTADSGTFPAWLKKQVTVPANTVAEYDEKINELLFAFSTDSGSLNTWKGYAVKPAVDGSNSEEYVQEFADGARRLLGLGGNSYIIVATDYGYHVMFYSEIINGSYGFNSLVEYLDSLGIEKDGTWDEYLADMLDGWKDFEDTDNFLYTFVDSLTSAKVSAATTKAQNKIINEYRYSDKVTVYSDSYADLLG